MKTSAKRKKTKAARRLALNLTERERGATVTYNSERIAALVTDSGKPDAELSRITGVDRKQIRRFKTGSDTKKTHAADIHALADFFEVPFEDLIMPTTPTVPTDPAAFAVEARAARLAASWRSASGDDSTASDLDDVFESLLSADSWLRALYDNGTPIAAFGSPDADDDTNWRASSAGGRALREHRDEIDSRRLRFARLLGEAFDVLLEPATRKQRPASMNAKRAGFLLCLIRTALALTESDTTNDLPPHPDLAAFRRLLVTEWLAGEVQFCPP